MIAWNDELGVWQEMRAADAAQAMPDPLYIFGYGSLVWKADFPKVESWVGRIFGYRRLFAQRSTGVNYNISLQHMFPLGLLAA